MNRRSALFAASILVPVASACFIEPDPSRTSMIGA